MRGLPALLALLLLAGCLGGSRDAPGTGEGEGGEAPAPQEEVALAVATTAPYSYSPAELSAPAGSLVTLTYSNDDPVAIMQHDWVLEEADAATEVVGTGQSATVTFEAPEPGSYTFYCSVGNHRQLGMVGTLTVT